MTPSEQEISQSMASLISSLVIRADDNDEKNRILFSAAINAAMLFIVAVKLQTGVSTLSARESVINLINEHISNLDEEGDNIITWHDGEARA